MPSPYETDEPGLFELPFAAWAQDKFNLQKSLDELGLEAGYYSRMAGNAKDTSLASGHGWLYDRLDESNIRPRMRFNPDVQLDTSHIQDRRADPRPEYPELGDYEPIRPGPRWPYK